MTHNAHPDVHTAGLADDCTACAELADAPWRYGDNDVLADLVVRAFDRANGGGFNGRSVTEDVAVASVLNVLERVGKLAEVAPATVADYLRTRWRLDASIDLPSTHPLAASRG